MVFQLRDYQLETAGFLAKRGRALNADEMGLGKTVSTLEAVRLTDPRNVLILAPNAAMGVWEEHVRSHLNRDVTVYSGSRARRDSQLLRSPSNGSVVIAPYSLAAEVVSARKEWPLIIADEAHVYRNRQTQIFKTMCRFRSEMMFPATGSPVLRDTKDIWAQLHLLKPNRFSSYWKFVRDWYNTYDDGFGHMIVANKPFDAEGFRQMMRELVIRHTKVGVASELPEKIRRRIPVEMTEAQASFYNDLANNMLAEYGDRIVVTPTALAKITRLRQCLVTPALVGGPNSSAAMDVLQESLTNEFDVERPCLVFCPFTEAMPYLEEVAKKAGADYVGIVRGGMSWEAVQKVVRDFQAHGSPRKVLLASLLAATSWTATTAHSVYFIGFDWTPAVNWQAEDRAHRIGQTGTVEVSYIVNIGTVEEHIIDILTQKKSWEEVGWDASGMLKPRRAV